MLILLSILLLVNAAFAAIVWPPFYRRVAKDPRSRDDAGRATRFFTVHVVLFIAAGVIAAASLVAGVAGLVYVSS